MILYKHYVLSSCNLQIQYTTIRFNDDFLKYDGIETVCSPFNNVSDNGYLMTDVALTNIPNNIRSGQSQVFLVKL